MCIDVCAVYIESNVKSFILRQTDKGQAGILKLCDSSFAITRIPHLRQGGDRKTKIL